MNKKLVRQIAHICLFANDIDTTADWYQRVLGITKVFDFTRDGRVFGYYLDAGANTYIEVFENTDSQSSENPKIGHICFEVIDIDEAIAHVRELGYQATDKARGCDDTLQSWITDPDGVKIELHQYTPASAQYIGGDRVANW